jgi:hypothetical protein
MQAQSPSQGVLRQGMVEEVLQRRGSVHLCVFGESMLPSIWPGDVVTVARHPASRIEVGEVILFRRNQRFFLHRVRAIFSLDGLLRFNTRGDSAPQSDPPIPESDVLGNVVEVRGNQRIGSISPLGFSARALGWVLCHCDSLRSFALRIHSQSKNGAQIGRVLAPQATPMKSPVLFASE